MRINALRRKTGIGGFIWRFVWGPLNLLCAFGPLLALNLMQFPSLLLLPFSHQAFRRYNRFVALMVWGWWAWGSRRLIGLDVVITGDELPQKENAVVIANHQGMADILVLLCLAQEQGSIRRTTWMAKDVLKYVPGLGWGMAFLDTIFLKRNWADDEEHIKDTFATIIREDVPIWLISFPEGTRMRPAKLLANQEFAKDHGKPRTTQVLLPRTKGFTASIMGLRQHVQAIYNVTIGYEGKIPSLVQVIRGDVDRVHLHVKRHPIETLPEDRKALGVWLTEKFLLKDKRLEDFHRTAPDYTLEPPPK